MMHEEDIAALIRAESLLARRRLLLERLICAECKGTPRGDYMVLDSTWREANLTKNQFCCLPCFIKRLDRPIRMNDFTDAPINDLLMVGFSLGQLAAVTRGL